MADDDDDLPPGIILPSRTAAPSREVLVRCWPENDACVTVGDRIGGSWICLAWANGRCASGSACEARHQLPVLTDEQRLVYSADGQTHDVFGRRRDAAAAVTSVFDPLACQTIHVKRGLPGATQRERRSALDAFSEWGQIVKTWAVATAGEGYVKFKWRASAQFALEAMQGRPFEFNGEDPLELAWATTDPSLVQAAQSQQLALAHMEEAAKRRETTAELYERLEAEGKQLKRQRLEGSGGSGGGGSSVANVGAHGTNVCRHVAAAHAPTTAAGGAAHSAAEDVSAWISASSPANFVGEYQTEREGGSGQPAGFERYPEAEELLAQAETPADGDGETATAQEDWIVQGLPAGWRSATDPSTGVLYFYNEAKGCTQWSRPDNE